jgi:hypothetical protein
VSARKTATFTSASGGGISKNTDLASAIATIASPATLPKCASP